jgi:hypothetical protein
MHYITYRIRIAICIIGIIRGTALGAGNFQSHYAKLKGRERNVEPGRSKFMTIKQFRIVEESLNQKRLN